MACGRRGRSSSPTTAPSRWRSRRTWMRRPIRSCCARTWWTTSRRTPIRSGLSSRTHPRSTTRPSTPVIVGVGRLPAPSAIACWRRPRRRRSRGTRTQLPAPRRSRRSATTRSTYAQLVQYEPVHRRNRGGDPAAEPRLQLRVDQPVVRGALQPGHDVHVTAAQRHRRGAGEPLRDAQPDARLVLPPRLHRADVQHAAPQLRSRWRGERSGAGQRPGGRRVRRPRRGSRHATTPTRSRSPTVRRRSPTCTCGSRSPAAFYAPCVDGDYDMS